MIKPHIRGDGQMAIFEGAAVEHQGVVLLTGAGDELVHDAAAGAYEDVFRALAGERDGGQREGGAGQFQQGHGRGHFNRCGRTESRAQGNIAI